MKQNILLKNIPKDMQIFSLAIPCLTSTGMIDHFIKSKLADNNVTIYNKFVKIEKDDKSGICIFVKDDSKKIPLNGIKLLLDNSSIISRVVINHQKFRQFVNAMTSLLDNRFQPVDLVLSNNEGWKINASQVTSMSHTLAEVDVSSTMYDSTGSDVTTICNSGTMNNTNVSPRKILDSTDYLKSLVLNITSGLIKDNVTIECYRGPSFNGGRPNDYLKIGTSEYFVIIACNITIDFEGISFASAKTVQR